MIGAGTKTSYFRCYNITRDYPYTVVFSGVGEPPTGKEHVGHCSQMAVFSKVEGADVEGVTVIETPYEVVSLKYHNYGILL